MVKVSFEKRKRVAGRKETSWFFKLAKACLGVLLTYVRRGLHPRASGTWAGPLTAKPPRRLVPTTVSFWAPTTLQCLFCINLDSALGLFPGISKEREQREQSKLVDGPSPGQETQPCCRVHGNKKGSSPWHRAKSYWWIRRISHSTGVITQTSLSPDPRLLWNTWPSMEAHGIEKRVGSWLYFQLSNI